MRLVQLVVALVVVIAGASLGRAAELSEADQAELGRLTREWTHLRDRANQAIKLVPVPATLPAIVAEAELKLREAEQDPAAAVSQRERALRRMQTLSAQINGALYPGAAFAAGFTPPYERQDPLAAVTPSLPREAELLALPGEHPAAALLIANTRDEPLRLGLTLKPSTPTALSCQIRRHVFMENWYRKEKQRATDPLTLLPREGEAWVLALEPGEVVQVHLGFTIGPRARGTQRCEVTLSGPEGPAQKLSLQVRVLAAAPPAQSPLEHLAFMYPSSAVSHHSPVAAAQDLAAHGVTMIEYPGMPEATFAADGKLLKADFHVHEALLRAYGPHIRRFLIFWIKPLKCEDGQEWAMLSPQWRVAFTNLLRAWFDHAAKLGYGQDRFVVMPVDEPSSHQLADAPNHAVRDLGETMAHLKREFPQLPIVATLSYYAYMPDLRVYLPHLDLAVVHWPWPEKLAPKFAPPTHNPRQVFFDEMLPLLKERRAQTGMTIISYHVASGKNDELLPYNRAYPALMVGLGQTGISHWAYNVTTGSTWHDWDGKPWLDYSFIYDGTEKHPLNLKHNPTGEVVVTSIRWEAVRAGMEDARLLLHLRTLLEGGKVPARHRERVRQALAQAEGMARGTEELTAAGYEQYARQLRLLYAEAAGRSG